MIFADKEFYETVYLSGRAPLIPLDEFTFWARKASDRINRNKIELEEIPEYLSMCVCEVAEAYFLDNEKRFMAMTPSESVGTYSKGAMPNLRQESKELRAQINQIINDHLANTPLHNDFVYRGGR